MPNGYKIAVRPDLGGFVNFLYNPPPAALLAHKIALGGGCNFFLTNPPTVILIRIFLSGLLSASKRSGSSDSLNELQYYFTRAIDPRLMQTQDLNIFDILAWWKSQK